MSKNQNSAINFAENTVSAVKAASVIFESAFELSTWSQGISERRRSFAHIVSSPVHYESRYSYPLIVWLHDAESSESEILDVAPRLSIRNYVTVAPRGLTCNIKRVVRSQVNGRLLEEKRWQEPYNDWPETEEGVCEAEHLVFDSIDQAVSKYNINRHRIFLVGRGVGGTMALRIALRNSRDFAGVVSIDGAAPSLEDLPLRSWRNARDLPILMTTGGLNSQKAPQLTASQLQLFHTAGMTVVIRQYNEHSNPKSPSSDRMSKILADVNVWLMERSCNPRATTLDLFGTC